MVLLITAKFNERQAELKSIECNGHKKKLLSRKELRQYFLSNESKTLEFIKNNDHKRFQDYKIENIRNFISDLDNYEDRQFKTDTLYYRHKEGAQGEGGRKKFASDNDAFFDEISSQRLNTHSSVNLEKNVTFGKTGPRSTKCQNSGQNFFANPHKKPFFGSEAVLVSKVNFCHRKF